MRIIKGEDLVIAGYVTGQTGDPYHDVRTIGIINDKGHILGGVVFTNFTGAGIELSLAGRGAVTRQAWQAIGDYAFGQMGCVRLAFTTRKSNRAAKRQLPKFGAKFEGVARKYYGSEDGLMFSLLRDEAISLGYWRP